MTTLPEVNELVRVSLNDDELVLPSRVEDSSDGDLLLAAAAYVGDVEGPREGSVVSIHWASKRGVCSVAALYLGQERTASGMRIWRVRPAGAVELVQRRRYARVEVNGALSVVNPEVDTVRVGWMLDLGEGGVRCRVAPGAFKPDEPVECRLNVDGDVIVVHGTILRAEKPISGYEELVVTFPDDHPASDMVRKHVFAEQLRVRRAASAGGQS